MNKSIELNGALLDHGPHPAATLPDVLPAVASVLTHPDEVMSHPELTQAEKRAILASWVSDARAVVNAPTLRQLDNGAVVEVDEVLHALRSLDDARTLLMGRQQALKARPAFARRRRTQVSPWLNRILRRDKSDDDDDPPPCPTRASIPVPQSFVSECPRRSSMGTAASRLLQACRQSIDPADLAIRRKVDPLDYSLAA